jgi:hypothetical protein
MKAMARITVVGLLAFAAGGAAAQCKSFEGDRGALKYQARGQTAEEKRCEGFTKLDMAALDGEVMSVTRGIPSYYYSATEVISIMAPYIAGCEVLECTGRARVSGSFYRLDMEIGPGETKYVPVKDVMLDGEVKNDRLGVVLRRPGMKETYVPVRVSSRLRKGGIGAPDSLFVKFLPRIALRDMAVEVYDGATEKLLYTGGVRGMLANDREVTVAIPVAALGLRGDAERMVLVQLKSKAEGPATDKEKARLDRSFTLILPKELPAQ